MKHRFLHIALNMTILLASSSTLPAAETPAPPKPDPILADLKTTAKADWRPESDFGNGGKWKPPTLRVALDFCGTAVKQASAYGELKLESVVAQDGKSYRRACQVYRGNDMQEKSLRLFDQDRNDGGFSIDLDIHNHPPIESFREIRGTLALRTGGEHKTIVIQNAFKNLGKTPPHAANEAFGEMNGVVQWIAEPLEDKTLSALGVKVAVRRWAFPKDDDKANDGVDVEVQSTDPFISGDILDAKGKSIDYGHVFNGGESLWGLRFVTTGKIPPDAQLQLTFHKNSRKIRAPFEFKNVAVPKIDPGNQPLNIAASADDAITEAESVRPDDPIIAGLTTKATAKWMTWGKRTQTPDLWVEVELQGIPVAQISACGEKELDAALDGDGHPLAFQEHEWLMDGRFVNSSTQTDCGVRFTLPRSLIFSRIRELRGSMSVLVGGRFETIVLKDFLKSIKKRGDQIDDPTLKSLGITINVTRQEITDRRFVGVESLSLGIEWKHAPVVWCEVTDADGRQLDASGFSYGYNHQLGSWDRSFSNAIPDDAQLRLTIHKDSRKVRVPFQFKNIEIPPIPDEDEENAAPIGKEE
jgi:hypothetical protein